MVPEADKIVALFFQICRPCAVTVRIMLPTANFHDQIMLRTEKIDDEWTNRCLPPKFETVQLPVAEDLPKHTLAVRGIAP